MADKHKTDTSTPETQEKNQAEKQVKTSVEKPMPYHNEPSQQGVWYMWVALAVVAVGGVSFTLFAPSLLPEQLSNQPMNAQNTAQEDVLQPLPKTLLETQAEHVDFENTQALKNPQINPQTNLLKEEILEDTVDTEETDNLAEMEALQGQLSNMLVHVQQALDNVEKRHAQTEENLQKLTEVSQAIEQKANSISKTVQSQQNGVGVYPQNTVLLGLDTLQYKGQLTKETIDSTLDHIEDNNVKHALSDYADMLENGKNSLQMEDVLTTFYKAYMKGAPKKPNLITYDDMQNTWADKFSRLLAKFVYVTRTEKASPHTTSWPEAMVEVETALTQKMPNIPLAIALEKLNTAPLISDARLDDVRSTLSRLIAQKALWQKVINATKQQNEQKTEVNS